MLRKMNGMKGNKQMERWELIEAIWLLERVLATVRLGYGSAPWNKLQRMKADLRALDNKPAGGPSMVAATGIGCSASNFWLKP